MNNMTNGLPHSSPDSPLDPRFHPFGEICCEDEVKLLQDHYREYYFDHAPFNREAVESETYLIVGRRGSGKTSLAHYFSFQKHLKHAACLDVEEPELYQHVLSKVASMAGKTSELAIPRIVKIWDFLIWSVIFKEYSSRAPEISEACIFGQGQNTAARLIRDVLKNLISRFIRDKNGDLTEGLEDLLSSPVIEKGKEAVLQIARREPVIVAIDSLEHYRVEDESIMRAIAALIECAKKFNFSYAHKGVHLKVFVTAEVFPHLRESIISNTLKYVTNPVFLNWKPKDLIRLVCWRFYRYLEQNHQLLPTNKSNIHWVSFPDVLAKMWIPYFGEEVTNGVGLCEKTFPYVLRHTQMRPRQLVTLCNQMAKLSKNSETFPSIKPRMLIDAVRMKRLELADEVINSYSRIYPYAAHIIEAIKGTPMIFKGKELDKLGPRTASKWRGEYTQMDFRQIIAELGIVGRVRRWDKGSGIAEADFEYNLHDRLSLQVDDDCVIHPMFYDKLNTKVDRQMIVYPFPDHPEFEELRDIAS